MTALQFISDINRLGIHITLEGDNLKLSAPVGALTPKLRQAIVDRKPEIIALLSSGNSEEMEPHFCPVCHTQLQEERGRKFIHRWCRQWDHFDSWRALNGLKLRETDAPIFQHSERIKYSDSEYNLADDQVE